jgi:CRISPR-associated protein Cmr5
MKTRAQELLSTAAKLVGEVEGKEKEIRDIYGGLCHSFPVMVRTCGLCQAVAFSFDKMTPTSGGKSNRNEAHKLLLEHVSKILGFADPATLLKRIREDSASQYMLYTRQVLTSWVYFKRFAVSILKVEDARAAEEAKHD